MSPQCLGIAATFLVTVTANIASATAAKLPEPQARFNQPWHVTSFAKDSGLSQRSVNDIAFEPDGTAWIAASDGLYRYDGYRWKAFRVEDGLPSQNVRALLRTRKGELWVGFDKNAGVFDGRRFDPRGADIGLAGSSVKKIAEDPDGTLWFWSDLFLEHSTRGGVTSYRDGKWRGYHTEDGLPHEKVRSYFRDSRGRQFALTKGGMAQKEGDRWQPLSTPGCNGDNVPFSMGETADGGTYAPCRDGVLSLKDGHWTFAPMKVPAYDGLFNVIMQTAAGLSLVNVYDVDLGAQLATWNGREFATLSPTLSRWAFWAQAIREAPDGALWVVGSQGTIVRWQRHGAEWTAYDDLPLPAYLDRKNRVVFNGASTTGHFKAVPGTFAFERGGFVALPGPEPPRELGAREERWRLQGDEVVLEKAAVVLARHPPVTLGLASAISLAIDAAGQPWVFGTESGGAPAVVYLHDAEWRRAPGSDRLPPGSTGTLKPHMTHGVWLLLERTVDRRFVLAHLDQRSAELHPIDFQASPPDSVIEFTPDQQGKVWVNAQSTRAFLFEVDPGNDGTPARLRDEFRANTASILTTRDTTWFAFDDSRGGSSSFVAYRDGKMFPFELEREVASAVSFDDLVTVAAADRVYRVSKEQRNAPTPLSFFGAYETGSPAIADGDGNLWIALDDTPARDASVFRYHPDGIAPETFILNHSTRVQQNQRFRVDADAIERFGVKRNQKTFRYSWRFDQGTWSPFEALPREGLPVQSLAIGNHSFEIRAQDEGLDVDPTPVQVRFESVALPLQERDWFQPAVVATFVCILALALIAVDRARKLGGSNRLLVGEIAVRREAEQALQTVLGDLELRVEARTAELRMANAALQDQIGVRRRAESNLKGAQKELMAAAREAGMAEIATGVLHNVGNVLNSINVSASLVEEGLRSSKLGDLAELSKLLQTHAVDLPQFVATPRGQKIPAFVAALSNFLESERQRLRAELAGLTNNVDHVKKIVAMQQNHARTGVFLEESVEPATLIDDALRMQTIALGQKGVTVHKDVADLPRVRLDKHRVLQILINLVNNAWQAMDAVDPEIRTLNIAIHAAPDQKTLMFSITDNGIGISDIHLPHMFRQGFTTRKDGHGFGLHASSLAATAVGGSLTVSSEGPGRGATFTLQVPLIPADLDARDVRITQTKRSA